MRLLMYLTMCFLLFFLIICMFVCLSGGGSGIDGAGGGGGTSYVNIALVSPINTTTNIFVSSGASLSSTSTQTPSSANLYNFKIDTLYDTFAVITWTATDLLLLWEIEMAVGQFSEDFMHLDKILVSSMMSGSSTVTSGSVFTASYTLTSLLPLTSYRFIIFFNIIQHIAFFYIFSGGGRSRRCGN